MGYFSSELQLRFGLPEFPILYTASGVARLRAGYSFTEASALAQVARCEKPMLFIHGTADDFIPYEMMDTLYNAKPGDNKAELTAEGAGHGEAMYALGTATGIRCLILLRLIWRNALDSI
ncbi:alpha/beta hydrolase [Gemmiger formicilis]|nr:alpha/beta hydrolase [Gemmiger formicilis]